MSDKSNLILLSGGDDEGSRGEDEVLGQPRVQRPDQEEPKPAHRAALLVNVQNRIRYIYYMCAKKKSKYIDVQNVKLYTNNHTNGYILSSVDSPVLAMRQEVIYHPQMSFLFRAKTLNKFSTILSCFILTDIIYGYFVQISQSCFGR